MKVAVLIPDRNDRPKFLDNCMRMMGAQTLAPAHIELVNDAPLTGEKDITWRYRTGYDRLRNKGFDIIALIENDDWYAPNYLERMVSEWEKAGKPDLFGTTYTIYYHIKIRGWFKMHHSTRSSAMNTFIKPDLNFSWPVDNDPYTDIHLWQNLQGVNFEPVPIISLGIKHGEGYCGGRNHIDKLDRFRNEDKDMAFLKQFMDKESLEFYGSYGHGLTMHD